MTLLSDTLVKTSKIFSLSLVHNNIMTQGACIELCRACENVKVFKFSRFFMTRRKNATQRNARIEPESILALRQASTRRRHNVTQAVASYCGLGLKLIGSPPCMNDLMLHQMDIQSGCPEEGIRG